MTPNDFLPVHGLVIQLAKFLYNLPVQIRGRRHIYGWYALAMIVGLVTEVDADAEATMISERRRSAGHNSYGSAEKHLAQVDTRRKRNDSRDFNETGGREASRSAFDSGLNLQLPNLDGVIYQHAQTKDGRICGTAFDNTKVNKFGVDSVTEVS